MYVFKEIRLTSFEWWGGADYNATMLSLEELDNLEYLLEDCYPDGISEVSLNDIMRFDFDWVCESLGLTYNEETGEIER